MTRIGILKSCLPGSPEAALLLGTSEHNHRQARRELPLEVLVFVVTNRAVQFQPLVQQVAGCLHKAAVFVVIDAFALAVAVGVFIEDGIVCKEGNTAHIPTRL